MKQIFVGIIIICTSVLLLYPNTGHAQPTISVSAEHAVLLDSKSGRVLYEKDAFDPSLIASTTKIMTAIIAIESGKLQESVHVSERAIYTEGSSIYLTEGEEMKLIDLVYGLMLRSGNDAAVAIAEHVGGSVEGFVHMMNQKAAWLGMNQSHFENPHGLDGENHLSSAYDLALLMSYAMKNKTFQEVTGSEKYLSDNRDYPWMNKNKLLTRYYEPTNGGKTGFTKKAGRTLVSSAKKDGMQLIAVTLNAPDDWNDHQRMFEWGFTHYDMVKLQEQGSMAANGQNYYFPRDVTIPVTEQEWRTLSTSFNVVNGEGNLAGYNYFKANGQPIWKATVWKEKPERQWVNTWKQLISKLSGVGLW